MLSHSSCACSKFGSWASKAIAGAAVSRAIFAPSLTMQGSWPWFQSLTGIICPCSVGVSYIASAIRTHGCTSASSALSTSTAFSLPPPVFKYSVNAGMWTCSPPGTVPAGTSKVTAALRHPSFSSSVDRYSSASTFIAAEQSLIHARASPAWSIVRDDTRLSTFGNSLMLRSLTSHLDAACSMAFVRLSC